MVVVQLAGKVALRVIQISSSGATGMTVVVDAHKTTRTYTVPKLSGACRWKWQSVFSGRRQKWSHNVLN